MEDMSKILNLFKDNPFIGVGAGALLVQVAKSPLFSAIAVGVLYYLQKQEEEDKNIIDITPEKV
jgi:hypothetical protein